jgi:hypothetical protein
VWNSFARGEHDRKDNRHDPAFGLRKREVFEGTYNASYDATVGHIGTSVADVRDSSVTSDDETNGDATYQIRVVVEASFVTQAEATKVLPDNPLDDFRRQTAGD